MCIAHLAEKIAMNYYSMDAEYRHGRISVGASASFFVPKPFTPIQWAPMCREEEFLDRARIVREEIHAQLKQKSIRYNWHEADVSVLEGILARGDRKVGDAILKAYEHGALFDAWSEYYHPEYWKEAFAESGIDTDLYIF